MILTVTLNPAVDKLYILPELQVGEVLRVGEVHNTAGGKGLNVARVAELAGQSVIAMGFVGGHNGDFFTSLITEKEIECAFTKVHEETRSCINVRDTINGTGTEFLEPGKPITQGEIEQFLADYKAKLPLVDVVVIAGSIPKGVQADFYATLVTLAKDAGKKVILDTSGAALVESLSSKPTMIKPNEDEIKQICNVDINSREDLIATARTLQKTGIEIVAISLGGDGVLVVTDDGVYQGEIPLIKVVNTTGCGDSMVAGFAVGMATGKSIEETIGFAVCTGSANALTKKTGSFEQEVLDDLLTKVKVTKLQ